ncbi:hypothetical protein KC902_03325 [Candidatus Kaiserbacteria bacterium]|nr:hypothetical protein [Candidatus Kaiserbacteria bacterium]USN88412.1 MAG: hypothetical protein H6780_02845 [Candidatus Nomurabacteria bacterium]
MGKTATNLVIVLGLITVAFAGFYLYMQQENADVSFGGNNTQDVQAMLRDAQEYISYGDTLKAIDLKVEFFDDPRLLSYKSFSTQVQDRPIGRPNPFADTTVINPAAIDF